MQKSARNMCLDMQKETLEVQKTLVIFLAMQKTLEIRVLTNADDAMGWLRLVGSLEL